MSSPPHKKSRGAPNSPSAAQLPVEEHRRELLDLIRCNQVCVVCGETGSGKTTMLPKFLLEAGLASPARRLVVTQPRRIATLSVAQRVSALVGGSLGGRVGYSVRFDERVSAETCVQFMTDGRLLRELLANRTLDGYGLVMVDEAHERSLNTDVLLALLKQLLVSRPDLKVVISSATLDATKFSKYFGGCPVYKLEGRLHDVQVFFAKSDQKDVCAAAAQAVRQIHSSHAAGDVLVFLPGVEEISKVEQELMNSSMSAELELLSLHGQKSLEEQQRVFSPAQRRKVVLATNIAETSITVPNIVHVVDSGLVKEKQFDSLSLTRCSQASAKQRAGRAGRLSAGMCFRLYPAHIFELMPPFSKPEVLRTNLQSTLLMLLGMDINIFTINMLDQWSQPSMLSALEALYALGAVNKDAKLTKLGRVLCEFPTSPELAKLMVSALHGPMLEHATIIAAMAPEYTRLKQRGGSNAFELGDWGALLDIFYKQRREIGRRAIPASSAVGFVRTQAQLHGICVRIKRTLEESCTQFKFKSGATLQDCAELSFPLRIAKRNNDGTYTTRDGTRASIHPSSVLAKRAPPRLVYCEQVLTNRLYLLCCLPLG